MARGYNVNQIRSEKPRLWLRLLFPPAHSGLNEFADRPAANLDYTIEVAGKTVAEGTTTEMGGLEAELPLDAKRATLKLAFWTVELEIGELPPVYKPNGQQARLNNLGLAAGTAKLVDLMDDQCRRAFERFKALVPPDPLTPPAEVNVAAMMRLGDVHGN